MQRRTTVRRVGWPIGALVLALGCGLPLAVASAKQGGSASEGHDASGHQQSGDQRSGDKHAEDGTSGERRSVTLNAQQRSHLDLDTVEARAGQADSIVRAPVELLLDPDRRHRVGPLIRAKVERVPVDLGDEVEPGDTLAVLNSVELGQAKSRYLAARARYSTAQQAYRREQRLAEQQISSEAEVLEARAEARSAQAELDAARTALELYGVKSKEIDTLDEAAAGSLARIELTAPAAGTVEHRDVSPGETLSDSDTPFTLVDTSRLWAMLDVQAERVAQVTIDDRVEIAIDGVGEPVTGSVSWISRAADSTDRRVRVRVILDNADGRLRPGLFGDGRIFTARNDKSETVLVPLDAVQRLGEGKIVFVPGDHEGEYRAQHVETGRSGRRFIEIRDGLSAGTSIVASGAFDLKAALTASGRSAAHGH